jgi:hypothetical protein
MVKTVAPIITAFHLAVDVEVDVQVYSELTDFGAGVAYVIEIRGSGLREYNTHNHHTWAMRCKGGRRLAYPRRGLYGLIFIGHGLRCCSTWAISGVPGFPKVDPLSV